ncbi:MAG: FAD-dependent oxidoreductase [Caldilineaceae bacterium]|nr:FAD-dependent oxidoreductase [Caldilineaceae bacterium]HRJ42167.1 FAD-dependent oxidoreductase [Caldilineaceae bacterium]
MTTPFDILFEPVRIGPVTAPNRFYQVPHCNGMGYRMPHSMAAMRGMKAEGGWGVICTEEVEIHHTSDNAPYIEGRLWSDEDIPLWQPMTAAIHAHGSLAGIELAYNGLHVPNLFSRVPPLGPRSMSVSSLSPVQTRRMDKEDFRNLRRWHREAALRAKRAGFDIIYCYAAHNMTLAMQLMLRRYNDRTDEYGGSLQNRVRLFRELIEDTKEAVGDSCGVAVRFAVDELLGDDGLTSQGEGYEIVAMLAELPDLWDVNVSGWANDSATSRFEKEGYQERYIAFVKSLTSKPVVGVGRYTSPDSMVSAIRRGVMDLIGAARPSIADPFLPRKVQEDRLEDIRECIGCNICVTGDMQTVPIRCTQNPTMGEEWRRGWHPEQIQPRRSAKEVLVVGGGPAGLECARALGQRGYTVVLTEARRELGGRVILESALPGLSEWRRVAEWRLGQLAKLPNVSLYPGSPMAAADVLESGIPNVLLATGATWRRDGIGRSLWRPVPGSDGPQVYTPDDLMAGRLPTGRVVIYDDDSYYMGGVLAELLAANGCQVTLITPATLLSYWTQYSLEQKRIQQRLARLGVFWRTQHSLTAIQPDGAQVNDLARGGVDEIPCDGVVLVTERQPNDALYTELLPALDRGKLDSLRVIGDAEAPGIIAQAVYMGHLAAREFEEKAREGTPFLVERTAVA